MTLDEAREQCEIDPDLTVHDAKLNRYIKAAREAAEKYLKGSIIEQVWRMTGASFPTDGFLWGPSGLELLNGPVIQINSVSYLDSDRARQVMDAAGYFLDIDNEPPRLYVGAGSCWPYTRPEPGNVQIEYTAGWLSNQSPAAADGVPEGIRLAILMLVTYFFENRAAAIIDARAAEVKAPFGFYEALEPYRQHPY